MSPISDELLYRKSKRLLFRTTTGATTGLPLSGIRVLELGQAIAGPFAGQLLGYALQSSVAQPGNQLLVVLDTLVPRSSKSRHQPQGIRFEYGEDWMSMELALGGEVWPETRRVSRST